jgi:hypothetical protein
LSSRAALTARVFEVAGLTTVCAAQAYLFSRPIHTATNYDEAVYLAALDALRHGQSLGSDVFAAQFPGFYDLLRVLSYATGIGVTGVRTGLIAVTLLGTIGGWLVGRRYGGAIGGLLVAAFLTIAPPLDLFSFQVIADTPALALMLLSAGLATLGGPVAAIAAGAIFGCALSLKLTAVTVLPVLVVLLRRRAWFALGGFAVASLALAAVHLGGLGELWSSNVTYHSDARNTPAVIPHPHRQILEQIPHRTPFFVLAIVAAALAVALALRYRRLAVWPLWTWVVLGVAFLFFHAPLHYNHLVLFPFALAVAAGATIGAALERVAKPVLIACCVLLTVIVGAAWVQQLHRVDLVQAREPQSNVDAARALDRLTPPGSLTVDDRPIISFLAHRRVDGALVDTALLRFETRSLTDSQVIHELQSVRVVVVSRVLARRPAVVRYLATHFKLRYNRGGVRIYTRS